MNSRSIRVWDLPVRLFHWLLLALVIGAVATVKIGGNAMTWHGRIGQAILALIVFRIVWGFVGSTTARFTHFVRGPGAIIDYLRGRWTGIGHSPLGALSVLALLFVIGAQATTGLFATDDIAFNGPLYRAVSASTATQLSGWHRQAEWLIYGLVALHLAAVLFYRFVRKDDLITPMITGIKPVSDPSAQPTRGGGPLAFTLALVIAGLAVWVTGGGLLPPPPPPPPDLGW
jgi:cytochrome b